MEKEKTVLIGLVIAVMVLAIAFVLIAFPDILPQPTATIEDGDCIDMSYIGRYASNNTIFDSSYLDPDAMTNDTPLSVFVSIDPNATTWKTGYTQVIPGLVDGLIGLKEGETATIGPIDPEDAYGLAPEVGTELETNFFTLGQFNQTIALQEYGDNLTFLWIDPGDVGDIVTPPIGFLDLSKNIYVDSDVYQFFTPVDFLENSTEIINISDDFVTYRVHDVNASEFITEPKFIQWGMESNESAFLFPNATEITWTNDTMHIVNSPVAGENYTIIQVSSGITFTASIHINSVQNNTINITMELLDTEYAGQTQMYEFPSVLDFNRTFSYPREYTVLSVYMMAFEPLFEELGYSLSTLAGESLLFEVTIQEVYKEADAE